MFLGGCPCCGEKECWRCYEFNSVACDNWDAVLQSGKSMTFEYSSAFSDASEPGWQYGTSFNLQLSESVYFPPSNNTGEQLEIEVDGQIVTVSVLFSSAFPGRMSLGMTVPWYTPPVTGPTSGLHGLQLSSFGCNNQNGFQSRVVGFTPSFLPSQITYQNYSASVNNSQLFNGVPNWGGAPGISPNNQRLDELQSTCLDPDDTRRTAFFPEDSLGGFSTSADISFIKLGGGGTKDSFAYLRERWSVTELFSEEYGNLLMAVDLNLLDCSFTSDNWVPE